MSITIIDLNSDINLDKAALRSIMGGNGSTVVGNSIAMGGYNPVFPAYKDCHVPCNPYHHYGPKAFQLNYNTSYEQAYYQKAQTSLNLSYFQA